MITRQNAEWTRTLLAKYVPQLNDVAKEALAGGGKPWRVLGVDQNRGRCYYYERTITVPYWARAERTGEAHTVWYLCHEIAHILAPGHGHDLVFMEALKRVCPPESIHYELGYQPRTAAAAGIRLPATPPGVNPLRSQEALQRALRYLPRTTLASTPVATPVTRSKAPAKRKNPNTQQHVDALKAEAAKFLLVLYYDKCSRLWALETATGRSLTYFSSRQIAAFTVSSFRFEELLPL